MYLRDCYCCGHGLTDADINGECPRCDEPTDIVMECENCGYQCGGDELIYNIGNGYCRKCAHPWTDDDASAVDDDGNCPECEEELSQTEEEQGECFNCGAML